MAVHQQSCDGEVQSNWLQQHLQVGKKIQETEVRTQLGEAPLHTHSQWVHGGIEELLLLCEVVALIWGEQPWTERICCISINGHLSSCLILDPSEHLLHATDAIHSSIVSGAWVRTERVCHNAIWQHDMLEFQPMPSLMSAEHLSLTSNGSANVSECAVDESKHIGHRSPFVSNDSSISLMVHPRLIQNRHMVGVSMVNISQHAVENQTTFTW